MLTDSPGRTGGSKSMNFWKAIHNSLLLDDAKAHNKTHQLNIINNYRVAAALIKRLSKLTRSCWAARSSWVGIVGAGCWWWVSAPRGWGTRPPRRAPGGAASTRALARKNSAPPSWFFWWMKNQSISLLLLQHVLLLLLYVYNNMLFNRGRYANREWFTSFYREVYINKWRLSGRSEFENKPRMYTESDRPFIRLIQSFWCCLLRAVTCVCVCGVIRLTTGLAF